MNIENGIPSNEYWDQNREASFHQIQKDTIVSKAEGKKSQSLWDLEKMLKVEQR